MFLICELRTHNWWSADTCAARRRPNQKVSRLINTSRVSSSTQCRIFRSWRPIVDVCICSVRVAQIWIFSRFCVNLFPTARPVLPPAMLILPCLNPWHRIWQAISRPNGMLTHAHINHTNDKLSGSVRFCICTWFVYGLMKYTEIFLRLIRNNIEAPEIDADISSRHGTQTQTYTHQLSQRMGKLLAFSH